MAELQSLLWILFLILAVDFLTLAVLTQNKAVAKARDPESPEREIQTGLNCGYNGLSKLILSFAHSSSRIQVLLAAPYIHIMLVITRINIPDTYGTLISSRYLDKRSSKQINF